MKILKSLFVIISLGAMAGCAGSKMSTIPYEMRCRNQQQIKAIAILSGAGVLGDAIAVELTNQGYQVFDSQQLSNLLLRSDLSELEISQPQNLRALKEKGIDAYLSIRTSAGYDGLPESASVRLNSTSNGKVITGVSWQNGWGGKHGSVCDRVMRKNVSKAASEITCELTKGMK